MTPTPTAPRAMSPSEVEELERVIHTSRIYTDNEHSVQVIILSLIATMREVWRERDRAQAALAAMAEKEPVPSNPPPDEL